MDSAMCSEWRWRLLHQSLCIDLVYRPLQAQVLALTEGLLYFSSQLQGREAWQDVKGRVVELPYAAPGLARMEPGGVAWAGRQLFDSFVSLRAQEIIDTETALDRSNGSDVSMNNDSGNNTHNKENHDAFVADEGRRRSILLHAQRDAVRRAIQSAAFTQQSGANGNLSAFHHALTVPLSRFAAAGHSSDAEGRLSPPCPVLASLDICEGGEGVRGAEDCIAREVLERVSRARRERQRSQPSLLPYPRSAAPRQREGPTPSPSPSPPMTSHPRRPTPPQPPSAQIISDADALLRRERNGMPPLPLLGANEDLLLDSQERERSGEHMGPRTANGNPTSDNANTYLLRASKTSSLASKNTPGGEESRSNAQPHAVASSKKAAKNIFL